MNRATLQGEHSATEPTLYVALELGGTQWKLAASPGDITVTERNVSAGDVAGLMGAIATVRGRQGLPETARVRCCYEAGRDGFWLHRELERRGVATVVVDSASIEVNRRARRAKTDRLDARKLLTMLIRFAGGERTVWRVVRVPTVEQEDARRVHREVERLIKERTAHTARLKSLLALHGVRTGVGADWPARLETLRQRDGQPLPPRLVAELGREWRRRQLVVSQLHELTAYRRQQRTAAAGVAAQQVQQLVRLKGLGEPSAWVLAEEIFSWRELRNQRQAGALVGLTPTPYASAGGGREQGISKAGNRHVRRVLIQLAWGWVRYQPHSALTQWFQRRFGPGSGRMRRVGIVALARRLFIALWHFVAEGVIPAGVRLRAA